MAEKEKLITGRFIMKHDTETNWQKAVNFAPKRGEVIIYEADETHESPRLKIGDGVTKVNDLAFVRQPMNWSANEGEDGYIENRTHYVVSVDEIMILPETALNTEGAGEVAGSTLFTIYEPLPETLVPDMEYTVIYNGAKYECIAKVIAADGMSAVVLGNIEPVFGGEDTGEPFVFIPMPEEYAGLEGMGYAQVTDFDGAESVTIEITAINEVVKTIDPKYLGGGKGPHKQLVTDADGNSHWEDRTHWVEVGTVELLPTTTITADENGEMALTQPIGLEANKTYTVNWNGAEYACAAAEMNIGIPAIALGNLPLMMESGDTGEPFVILEVPGGMDGMYAMVVSTEGLTEVVVSISHTGKQVHKLDKQFLPEYDWNAEPGADGYIANRTHYTANVGTLVCDMANLAGMLSASLSELTGYKVSDYVLDGDTLANSELYTADTANGTKTQQTVSIMNNEDAFVVAYGGNQYIISTSQTNLDVYNATFPAIGTYIFPVDKGYVELVVGDIVKKIDEKYLPEPEVTKTYLNEKLTGFVPTTRTVNGKALRSNITLTAADVGAVPTTRTVNGKTLSSDITLSSSDVGADAAGTAQAKIDSLNIQNGAAPKSLRTVGAAAESAEYSLGASAFAEGEGTIASGWSSHAEGKDTVASAFYSHAEGNKTLASGVNSHAEGNDTHAVGNSSHAEGRDSVAIGDYSHVEGQSDASKVELTGEANATIYTYSGNSEIKIGRYVNFNNIWAKITDFDTINSTITVANTLSSIAISEATAFIYIGAAGGESSHAEGRGTLAGGAKSHAEGVRTIASGPQSHAEGCYTVASEDSSHAEGCYTVASGRYSHAEGGGALSRHASIASGESSHAEGHASFAVGTGAHAEGGNNSASSITLTGDANSVDYICDSDSALVGRHVIDNSQDIIARIIAVNTNDNGQKVITLDKTLSTEALTNYSAEIYLGAAAGSYSHAEGCNAFASGNFSHAEGYGTIANGDFSHAEGQFTEANGDFSHAEGLNTTADGERSHAEGFGTRASGGYSHAEGDCTHALSYAQHVQGKYNNSDSSGTYAHIVGNGDRNKRSNAHTLDWQGNAWYAGDVYVGGTSQDDATAERLARTSDLIAPRDYLALTDQVTGKVYRLTIENGNLVTTLVEEGE